jgi:hypothetical protein
VETGSSRWTTVSDSPHDHEREALAFLRRRLPDREPYHVWSNLEFVARSGALYEVDALAITDNGLYLIEIKSHPGVIAGDGTTWQWTTPEGRIRRFDNPRLLANRKAKALKEVLSRTKTFGKRPSEIPFVTEVVFLSDPRLEVHLNPPGRHQVFGRDAEPGQEIPRARASIGGIVGELTTLQAMASGRPRRRIDRPLGTRLVKAVGEVDVRERTSRRLVHGYEIVELLDDVEADRDTGVAYQDFLVRHQTMKRVERRWRLYPLELNATGEQRTAGERAARREFEHLHRLRHPGIVAPVELVEHERGPGLLFDHDPAEQRLDRWLTTPGVLERLTVGDRLGIVRDLSEALAHAHGNGIYHRAVCPSAVYVRDTDDQPVVRLANWHAGARLGTGDASTSMTATSHLEALSGGDAELYRAPEHTQELAAPAGPAQEPTRLAAAPGHDRPARRRPVRARSPRTGPEPGGFDEPELRAPDPALPGFRSHAAPQPRRHPDRAFRRDAPRWLPHPPRPDRPRVGNGQAADTPAGSRTIGIRLGSHLEFGWLRMDHGLQGADALLRVRQRSTAAVIERKPGLASVVDSSYGATTTNTGMPCLSPERSFSKPRRFEIRRSGS